jgi:Flp pilus assembly protein TadD/TolB-like protein
MELKPGDKFGPYELVSAIGKGGMGEVWKAIDTRLHRDVAIKFCEHRFSDRFLHEARAIAALNHPNICTLHDIGPDFLVMEYIEGSPPRGPLAPAKAVRLALAVAAALEAAHSKGITHRDLKPANVLVTQSGLKLLDFGLAKTNAPPLGPDDETHTALTKVGHIAGTLQYMSPEQLQGKEADARSDIFAFGCLLYEVLSGAKAFLGPTAPSVIVAILDREPESLKTTPLLDRVIRKCLKKDPDERFQTARDLTAALQWTAETGDAAAPGKDLPADLEQVGGEREGGLAPASSAGWRARAARQWRWLAASAVCLVVVLGLGWRAAQPWFSGVPAHKKIAVLPFLNIGGAGDTQALCDGIMEALTSELTQLEQFHGSLWVVPSTEVRRERFAGAAGARRVLGANLVISGSLQRDSSHVHLTANLVDTGTLRQLSSRTIEKPFAEFADLQEEVVREIARMLELEIGNQESRILAADHTKAAGAYELYLQAQGYLQRRNAADLDRAIDLLERAVAQDSNYVLAYAGLGEAYWRKYRATSDSHWVELAERDCNRAVALNDHLAPVYVALGIVQEGTGQHEQAIRSFQRALELDPINSSAHSELGNSYLAMGKLEEAESIYKKAAQLRPDDFTSLNGLGLFYYGRGRYQDATKIFQRTTELVPDNSSGYTNLGAVYWMDGQYQNAAISYEKSLALRPTASAYSSLGTVYFFLDRCAEAVPLMEKAAAILPKNDQVWGNLADVYGCSPNGREKAAQAYRQALQLSEALLLVNPKDAEALSRAALYMARLGENGTAVVRVKRAMQLAPNSRAVVWNAARTYELSGQRELALESVRAALESGQPLQEVSHEPAFVKLRSDPRYAQLIADKSGKAR